MNANCGLCTGIGAPPEPDALLDRHSQQLPPFLQRVGDRFLAPDMTARLERLSIEVFVFLHVGQVHQEIERCAGQHLVDVRVVVGNRESLRLPLRTVRADVTEAHQLDIGAFGKHGEIRVRDAPASDEARADAPLLFATLRPHQRRAQGHCRARQQARLRKLSTCVERFHVILLNSCSDPFSSAMNPRHQCLPNAATAAPTKPMPLLFAILPKS